MPPGLANKKDRNPLNFTREEWQQAKRAGANPKEIKRIFQDSWATSDSRKAFAQALLQQGFVLARGDRRGFVALDYRGEAYAIAKYTGVRTKAVKERLGDPQELPSVEEAKAQIAANMTDKLKIYLEKAERDKQRRTASFEFKSESPPKTLFPAIDLQRGCKAEYGSQQVRRRRLPVVLEGESQRCLDFFLGKTGNLSGGIATYRGNPPN